MHFGTFDTAVDFYSTNNYSWGDYEYLQIDSVFRYFTYSNAPHATELAGVGLDRSFPFGPTQAGNHVIDFPGDGLLSSVGMLSAQAHDDFTLYLMFQPNPVDESFYVPLRKLDWHYWGSALPDTNSTYGWSLVLGSTNTAPIGTDTDAPDYPSWTNNASTIRSNQIIITP